MKRMVPALAVVALILIGAVIPAAAQPQERASAQSVQVVQYVVRAGDTLNNIARRFCTTASTIYNMNAAVIGPNPDRIYPGMVLTVPNNCGGGWQPYPLYPPSGGVYDRGPRQHAMGPVYGNIYTVVPGDTMYSVSARFGLTVQQLSAANGIPNPCILWAGQRLVIPGLGTAPCQPGVCPPQPCYPNPCPPPQPWPTPIPPTPQPVQAYLTITSPAPGAVLPATFTVMGSGAGLVEGNVLVRALDAQGLVLAQQTTVLQGANVGAGGPGTWSITLTVNVASGTPGMIQATSPGTPSAPQAAVSVTFGAQSQTRTFAPGECLFQAWQGAPFYDSPGGAQSGTFGTGGVFTSLQGQKVNGVAWYQFATDPGSGNVLVWTPVSSISAYTSGCVW